MDQHIMLDLETLSTRPDAIIASIGAVKFTENGFGAHMYIVCDLHQPGRHMSPQTLAWWMQQSEDARAMFNDPQKVSLAEALDQWRDFVNDYDYLLWSNGADFDIPIINHALATFGATSRIRHSNHRCYRTIKNLYKHVPLSEFIGAKHNALSDAVHQAKHVQEILKAMK